MQQLPSQKHIKMGCCALTPKRPPPQAKARAAQDKRQDVDIGEVEIEEVKFQKQKFIKKKQGRAEAKYTYAKQLGKGTFGTVYAAKDKVTGAPRAIKIIPKGKKGSQIADIENEVNLLKRLDHPNIVQIYEVFEDANNFSIVTEYCAGGELFDYVVGKQRLNESIAANVIHQVLSAVAYCHSQGIVHRDLKPENLLLSEPNNPNSLKVADFGTSTIISKTAMKDRFGTAYYIAPEVLKKNYDEKCDLWSIGVILYILLSGEPPFGGKTDGDIMAKVMRGVYSVSHGTWGKVSIGAKNFLMKLLKYNPRERLSALEALNDPWLRQHSSQGEEATSSALVSGTLSSLKAHHTSKKLQQGLRTYIATLLVSDQEKRRLGKVFKKLDTDGDGKLSPEELIEGYSQEMTQAEAVIAVEHIMKSIDVDRNGYVEYTEFIAATMDFKSEEAKKTLLYAFKAFDQDGSGKISADEIKQMLGDYSDDTQLWEKIASLGDVDGDGQIDIEEFKELIIGVQVS
jgi:calcium-dependent protein kinase